jgi:predicted nuclease with TOPRIM domain
METDRLSSLRRQYETLLTSILSDHKSYLAQIRVQRDSTASKMEDLLSRCERLELAVAEGTKELIKERGEKQVLQIRVEEMQTNIEQRIQGLRKRLDDSGRGSIDQTPELNKLKLENDQLRASVDEFKVPSSIHTRTIS